MTIQKITTAVTPLQETQKINEIIDNKQDTLVSGTNIKTINNNSILGSGNINISGQAAWGSITGTLSSQTDLQTALDDKLDTTQITNCITEIPQDIKLELSNGTLTLKAGSKVYSLDGSYNLINSDTSIANAWGSASKGIVFYSLGAAYNYYPFERLHSGSTNPTGLTGNSHINYNTTDNKFYQTTNAGSSWSAVGQRLPIACVTWDANNKITSIDQVFNGFGYIGSTVFALPGVKGLAPNGRNDDGTLKNVNINFTQVSMTTDTSGATGGLWYVVANNSITRINYGTLTYDTKRNYIYITSSGSIMHNIIIDFNAYRTSGKITSFNPKTAFHAVDYSDFSDLKDTVDTKANDSNVVHKTGNETIADTKTFSSSPIVPTPATSDNSTKTATTAYVNNKHQKVSTLPVSADADVYYYIPE